LSARADRSTGTHAITTKIESLCERSRDRGIELDSTDIDASRVPYVRETGAKFANMDPRLRSSIVATVTQRFTSSEPAAPRTQRAPQAYRIERALSFVGFISIKSTGARSANARIACCSNAADARGYGSLLYR